MRIFRRAAVLVSVALLVCGLTRAATTSPVPISTSPNETDNGWPRDISNGEQITIYEPQVEKWEDNQLSERAAVSVKSPASPELSYGVIWITARTEVDRENHLVTLENVQIPRAKFPGHPERTSEYLSLIRKNVPALVKQVALDRLQASLAITKAESRRPVPKLRFQAPRIIYSDAPAILILVDGNPVLRETGTSNILRVINTRALLLLDQATGIYYLSVADRWMQGAGPLNEITWVTAKDPPAQLDQVRHAASEGTNVDLLNDPDSAPAQAFKSGITPRIYVSTKPASLIQTDGIPLLQPVSNTELLYVTNTADSIFLNTFDQNYYILVTGRWYRSRSLKGPWSHISAKKLPSDFSQIPENHPKGSAVASVAGTPQAQEAVVSNGIPQTATVDRAQAALTSQYDGVPQFRPIQGTPLLYAINSSVPVIEVDPHTFYAVNQGVWFVATSPTGPWVVATVVPAVIYTIPPSSPLYFVTFVRVYGYTPEVVYVGYTPGYLNSYFCDEGVIVFGTGYVYPPWIGTVWIGYPVTFGLGVFWGVGFGWRFHGPFHAGLALGPAFYPWWGPWRARRTTGFREALAGHANVYRAWRAPVIRNTWDRHAIANREIPLRPGIPRGANNVYSTRDGGVFRYGDRGWEARSRGRWTPRAQAGSVPPSVPRPDELERSRIARGRGENQWNSFRESHRTGSAHAGHPGGRRR